MFPPAVPASQRDGLRRQRQEIGQLGELLAAETRQRAEERKGRTEAERRLRAEKQVFRSFFAVFSLDREAVLPDTGHRHFSHYIRTRCEGTK